MIIFKSKQSKMIPNLSSKTAFIKLSMINQINKRIAVSKVETEERLSKKINKMPKHLELRRIFPRAVRMALRVAKLVKTQKSRLLSLRSMPIMK